MLGLKTDLIQSEATWGNLVGTQHYKLKTKTNLKVWSFPFLPEAGGSRLHKMLLAQHLDPNNLTAGGLVALWVMFLTEEWDGIKSV